MVIRDIINGNYCSPPDCYVVTCGVPMTHHHYIAIIEFHSSGTQTMGEALLEKLKGLASEDSATHILNLVDVYEKR